jgi:hypothetical protein
MAKSKRGITVGTAIDGTRLASTTFRASPNLAAALIGAQLFEKISDIA